MKPGKEYLCELLGRGGTRCRGSCGSCGEVAGTKDKGSRLDFDKACATTLERLKIGGIILKSNVHERDEYI